MAPGHYVTGTPIGRSHVHLHLSPGAVLEACRSMADYPPQISQISRFPNRDLQPFHLLYFRQVEDMGLAGEGVLEGNGYAFWNEQKTEFGWFREKEARPSPLVLLEEARKVRVEGLEIRNSTGWTLAAM